MRTMQLLGVVALLVSSWGCSTQENQLERKSIKDSPEIESDEAVGKAFGGGVKKLYVGNLPWSTTNRDLRALFGRHGEVYSANVVMDRQTGRPRGFAFVEMATGADAAIQALDGSSFGGRNIRVNEAKPKSSRSGNRRRW